jgi:hypothetical protein
MKKIYKQKIKYHNKKGDFPKDTVWEIKDNSFYYVRDIKKILFSTHLCPSSILGCTILPKDFVENNPDIFEKIIKEPLLTTEDGIDVFDKDIVYSVNPFNFNINRNIIGCTVFKKNIIFSTKEAAQVYIDKNKLKYSEQDVIEILDRLQSFDCSIKLIKK